ncbi:MAG: cell division initiation protein [Acidimicrobiaceae bacterium]|jgi:DivIVA domain-containing protein|nr:cell division initiation protein [Acidimicrobiaceae bacterium]
MDVSPKTLREVEFREKMRGYHPEDVDQFLERVAAGIEVLQDRLRQAIERAQRAEQAATEAGGNDDALRRTLLLAQRTADLAVQEAREQAARIVAGAEQQAQSMVGDAEQRVHAMTAESERRAQAVLGDSERRAQSMVSEAEQQARRGHEDTLVEVRADLAKLEDTRQRLHMEVDSMTRWVADHRAQLRAALEDALTRIEQIAVAPLPTPAAPTGGTPATEPRSAVPSTPASAAPAQGVPGTPPGPSDEGADAPWAPPAAPVRAPVPAIAASPPPPADPPREEPLWQQAQPDVVPGDDAGGADPYFAELRRAISDHDPLGPRPEGDAQQAAGGRGAPGSET